MSSDSSSVTSVNSDLDETTTIDHSHGHHKGGYHHTTESDYSGRSPSDSDLSGLSNSSGTSQATGEASTVSSVSFTQKEYANRYEDNNPGAFSRVLDRDESFLTPRDVDKKAMKANPFSNLGGIEWAGDDDNERIFGTSWMDNLFGDDGDDNI